MTLVGVVLPCVVLCRLDVQLHIHAVFLALCHVLLFFSFFVSDVLLVSSAMS
jgi:hypothetical protein